MRDTVAFRVAMWATAGFLVSVGWALYFASASKAIPIQPLVYDLASATQPLAAAMLYSGLVSRLGFVSVAVTNAAMYGLFGLLVETVRKQQGRLLHDH